MNDQAPIQGISRAMSRAVLALAILCAFTASGAPVMGNSSSKPRVIATQDGEIDDKSAVPPVFETHLRVP
jgi:hypothetical protein